MTGKPSREHRAADRAQHRSRRYAPARQYSRRAVLAAALPVAVGLGAVGVGFAPRPPILGQATGDMALAEELRPHLSGHRNVAAVLIDGGTVRFVGFGADENTEFEIGSVSKTFTAAVVMAAIDNDELSLDDTVRTLVGARAEGRALGDTTMKALVTHTSGLPSTDPDGALSALGAVYLRRDAYHGDADAVIDAALHAELSGVGEGSYSNLGIALAGQLAARAGDATFGEMLRSRVIEPLGLGSTWLPERQSALDRSAPRGHDAAGRRQQAWTMEAWAPAGGVRSTGRDMSRYLQTMMDGSNPGAGAIEPLANYKDRRIGVCWMVDQLDDGGPMISHNGMTGGFASFCGWNPQSRRGVVLLSDTALSLDELAVDVISGKVGA